MKIYYVCIVDTVFLLQIKFYLSIYLHLHTTKCKDVTSLPVAGDCNHSAHHNSQLILHCLHNSFHL